MILLQLPIPIPLYSKSYSVVLVRDELIYIRVRIGHAS